MNVEAYKQQARLLEQKGQLAEALSLYKRVLGALEGTNGIWRELPLYVKAGDLLLKMSDARGAISMYEQAAKAYAVYGSSKSVIALCSKILRVAPGRTPVCLGLARLMVERGHVDHARLVLIDYAGRVDLPSAAAALKALEGKPNEEVKPQLEMLLELAHKAEGSRIQAEVAEKARDSLAAEMVIPKEPEEPEIPQPAPETESAGTTAEPDVVARQPEEPQIVKTPSSEEIIPQPPADESSAVGIEDAGRESTEPSSDEVPIQAKEEPADPSAVSSDVLITRSAAEDAAIQDSAGETDRDAEPAAESDQQPAIIDDLLDDSRREETQARKSLTAEPTIEDEEEPETSEVEVPSFLSAPREAVKDSDLEPEEPETEEQEVVQSPTPSPESKPATRSSKDVDWVGDARPSAGNRPRKAMFKGMEQKKKSKGPLVALAAIVILTATGFGLVYFEVVSLDDLLQRNGTPENVPIDSADAALMAGVDTTQLLNAEGEDSTADGGTEETAEADTTASDAEAQTPPPPPPNPLSSSNVPGVTNQAPQVDINVPDISSGGLTQTEAEHRGVMVSDLEISSSTPFEVEGRQGYRIVQLTGTGDQLTITAIHLGGVGGNTTGTNPSVQVTGDTSVGRLRFAGYTVEARAAVSSDIMEALLRRLVEVPTSE